jgi:hypothetical protein
LYSSYKVEGRFALAHQSAQQQAMADSLEGLPERLTGAVLKNILGQLKAYWKAEQIGKKSKSLKTCRKVKVDVNGNKTSETVKLEVLVSVIYLSARESFEVSTPSEK